MKTIKAILLDLGNVVVLVKPEAVQKGYAAHGKFEDAQMFNYVMDSDNLNRFQEGKITPSQFYNRTRRHFRLDISFSDFYKVWNDMFAHYPEMEEIIKTLKEKYPEVKLVLLSNTNEAHYEHIKKEYPILELLDGYVVSHELGKQKPHPDIYKEALKVAGTLPKETFYTDDRAELIDAARVMGIHAYQFTGHEEFRAHLSKFNIEV